MIGEYFYKKSNLLECMLYKNNLGEMEKLIPYRLHDGKDDGTGYVIYTLTYINPKIPNEIKSVSVSKQFLKTHYFSADDTININYFLDKHLEQIQDSRKKLRSLI